MKKQWIILLSLTAFFMMAMPFSMNVEAEAEGAQVRILHASPDAPAVDVYVNKDKVISGMKFKELSEYLPLDEGSYDIKVFQAGSKPKKSEPVLEENLTFTAGGASTIAVTGKLEDIALKEFSDDLTTVEDEAKLRVLHLSPDAPKVDVFSLDTPVVTDVGFNSATEYQTLPEGDYSLDIRPAGQDKAIFNVPNVELKKGENYTAIAVGLLKGEPAFDLILAKDS
ncbi:DUF4397 domain-containing protein [Salipaludibacillus daqingensis]|uniref:DUF4397 domain-containing protein n=1 Tax=Salipaludibacillus daqingensis TaxID=3041001 RepID=UPI00247520BB|nr:DUF4397 domain-containing protein [Salipaludibacillus daqingensis]